MLARYAGTRLTVGLTQVLGVLVVVFAIAALLPGGRCGGDRGR